MWQFGMCIDTVSALLGILVVVGIYIWLVNEETDKKKKGGTKGIPGPKLVDERLGHNDAIQAAGNLSQYLRQQHKIYGPVFGFYLGSSYAVSLGSPAALNQSRNLFDRPPFMFDMFSSFLGTRSLQVSNGDEARKRHSAYTRFLSFGSLGPYFPVIHKKISVICKLWSSHDGPVKVSDELRKYALMGIQTSLFRGDVPDDKEVLEFIDKYQEMWSEVERWVKGDYMEAGSEREIHYTNCRTEIHTMIRNLYKTATREATDDEETFLTVAQKLDLDEKTIVDDIFTFVAGGFHNSSYGMEWGLFFLAKYPAIQEKLYTEIQEVLGDEPITADAVKYLVYLRQFMDELQRWTTQGQFAARITYEDIEIQGYHIPANTPLVQALETIHFDERNYSDPEKFDPDRFAPERRKSYPPHSLEQFGFSGGRRCVGSQIFNSEAMVLFTTVTQKLQLSLPADEEEVHKELGTFSRPNRRVKVLVKARELVTK